MGIRSASTPGHRNVIWDLLFGAPAVNALLAQGRTGSALKHPVVDPHPPTPYLRLVEPLPPSPTPPVLPNTPLTPRFVPRPFGGAGWGVLAALLVSGGLYALERYANSPGDLPPSPDDDSATSNREALEQQRQFLEDLRRQYRFNGEDVPEWLRYLLDTIAMALAQIDSETSPAGHRTAIVNSADPVNPDVKSQAETPTPSAVTIALVVNDSEKLFLLDPTHEVTIGRHSSQTIQIHDPSVSRNHAIIRLKDGKVILEAVGQHRVIIRHGGTIIFTNTGSTVMLLSGTTIQIADKLFQFKILPQPETTHFLSATFKEAIRPFLDERTFRRWQNATDGDHLHPPDEWTFYEKYSGHLSEIARPSDSSVSGPGDDAWKGWKFYGNPVPADGRLYIVVNRKGYANHQPKVVAAIQDMMESLGNKFHFKVADGPSGRLRRDHVVVYFDKNNEALVTLGLIFIVSQFSANTFGDKGPYLTQKLARGVYFGEQPQDIRMSFGSLRATALSEAWKEISSLSQSGRSPSEDEKMMIIARYFQRHGIDIENPAFNSQESRFPFVRTLARGFLSSPPPTDPLTPDDWGRLADEDPVEFLRAVRRWDVATRHTIAARIDAGGTAPEILEWFKSTIQPMAKTIGTLITQPRKWPLDRRGLVHDMRARLRGFSVTEIYLEDGKLAHVRSMFNSEPGNLMETVVAIQFGIETVSFSIDGLRGVHLAPTFSPSLFNSILKNLIHNAAEHPGADPLQITIRLRGGEMKIGDNGAGMTPVALAAIRNGTPIHDGVPVDPDGPDRSHGQGWSKSIRESCERLGIQWSIDSEEGKGTTVTLTLPPNALTLDDQFALTSYLDEDTIRNHLIPLCGILTPSGQNRLFTEWSRVTNTTVGQLLLSFGLPHLE